MTGDSFNLTVTARGTELESAAARRRWLSRATLERAVSVLSPLTLVALWELSADANLINVKFFPAPSTILAAMSEVVRTGELWTDVIVSVQRILIGFLIGALPGIIIGIAMGLNSLVRAAVKPLVDATFPIPKVALVPLFILIFGIGEESKYATIAVAVVYLVLINTAAGVRNIDRIYLDVGKNFHASPVMMFTDIALPGALPMIMTGLKLGMGVAFIVIFTAELVGVKSGLGHLIWLSYQVFQIDKMYVGLVAIAIAGVTNAVLLEGLERLLIPWKRT